MQGERPKPIVGYLRVSTDKQGKSGLGLEAQQAAIDQYAKQTGAKILANFTEIESGKISTRPQLKKAIARAKREKAELVVAKLDRLSRNVNFTSYVMLSGVEFVCCDNPRANTLTIHILAAVAEDETRRIKDRTAAALAAYKARGGILGASRPECRNLTQKARKLGAKRAGESVHRKAQEAYSDILVLMRDLRDAGKSLQEIADNLNSEGHSTRRGKPWNRVQVMRVLKSA